MARSLQPPATQDDRLSLLAVPPGDDRWGGARQNDAEIGAGAMELLVGQLRRGERGTPPMRSRLLVESSPVAGRTVRATG